MKRGTRFAATALVVVIALGSVAYALVALRSSDAPAEVALGTADAEGLPDAGLTTVSLEGPYTLDAASSFVGYRVREKLAVLPAPSDAVGRTSDVSGSLQVEGLDVSNVAVTADLTTLQSDESLRDSRIGEVGLETQTFPDAAFTLTSPISFAETPDEGEVVETDASGTITLHGVTKDVTVPVQARWTAGGIEVAGSLDIVFADYEIVPPRFGPVNVGDDGAIEFQLVFVPAP
jgi:polyisoprenoid-binding protein YceI